jgi:hypothetical protein
MPRGRFPTGIVATTRRAIGSTTLTVPSISFETYTREADESARPGAEHAAHHASATLPRRSLAAGDRTACHSFRTRVPQSRPSEAAQPIMQAMIRACGTQFALSPQIPDSPSSPF